MTVKNLVEIKIKKTGINKKVDLFMDFLQNRSFPQHRNMILRAFPKIGLSLKRSKKERVIVKKFVVGFYKQYKNKIDKIINKNEKIIKKNSKSALNALARLMDYNWNKKKVYFAIPTILPFSPLKKDEFYFSILGETYGKKEKDILSISVHEISHFIFYDLLEELKENSPKLSESTKNYLKESLTAVLLNQKPLNKILKLKNYQGNPEIRNLKVKALGKTTSVVEFLNNYYLLNKRKKNFKTILKEMVKIMNSIDRELSKKRSIWNHFGSQLLKNKKYLKEYEKPIQIKMGQ